MTDAIRTCVENAERQVRRFSQRVQWPPSLLVISMFACENMHSVAPRHILQKAKGKRQGY